MRGLFVCANAQNLPASQATNNAYAECMRISDESVEELKKILEAEGVKASFDETREIGRRLLTLYIELGKKEKKND